MRNWVDFDHAHLLMITLFLASLALVYHAFNDTTERARMFATKRNAAALSDALRAFRTVYTREVVEKATRSGLAVSHEFKDSLDTIPLPASMTIEIGRELGKTSSAATSALYSAYPFPWRQATGGLDDSFKREAWQALVARPDDEFFRVETVDGQEVLRCARADVMRDNCVHCHNTHPESPKTDWRVGDVRGVLEITQTLDPIIEDAEREMGTFRVTLGLSGLLGFAAVVLVWVSYRRRLLHQQGLQAQLLLRANELEQFAYRSSHDLKAPLTTVKRLASFIDLDLKAGEIDEARLNVGKIHAQVERLERLVVDVLALARADLKTEATVPMNPRSELEGIREALRALLDDNDVALSFEGDLDAPILCQRTRVVQVLENLISNGVKYCDPNRDARFVIVSVSVDAKNAAFVVRDNGLGIPEDCQHRIFERFSRFHPHNADGSGLGMALVERHVQFLGGKVTFETSNRGSTFRVSIPLAGAA